MIKQCSLIIFYLLLVSGDAAASDRPVEKVQFYYPIAVRGEVTQLIDAMVDEFELAHPGIDIEPVYAGTYKESLDKVLTANKNGTPPTLAVLHAADMYTLIDAAAIVPFDAHSKQMDEEALKDFYPAFMSNSRAAGKTWGIPFQRSVILLYWNKRAFREAGLAPDRPPLNWNEMRSMADKLTVRDT